jgi:hypothetical protein
MQNLAVNGRGLQIYKRGDQIMTLLVLILVLALLRTRPTKLKIEIDIQREPEEVGRANCQPPSTNPNIP